MTAETSDAALYRLLAWLSPSYPVGAFSYSHGLEYAVEAGLVSDAGTARGWLRDVVRSGGARNDAVFLSCAHRAVAAGDRLALIDVAEMAAASAASAELALESGAQGDAFLRTTREIWPCDSLEWLAQDWPGPTAYPVRSAPRRPVTAFRSMRLCWLISTPWRPTWYPPPCGLFRSVRATASGSSRRSRPRSSRPRGDCTVPDSMTSGRPPLSWTTHR